jgi:hypothetical protein
MGHTHTISSHETLPPRCSLWPANYNRVEPAHLGRARFLIAIDAITTDGQRYNGFLATMQWSNQ